MTASRLYSPYGGMRYRSGSFATRIGYTGQRNDTNTNLDYYGARYYDPTLGQFTSADTVLQDNGFSICGLNRYAYVKGNPATLTDPSGNCPQKSQDWKGRVRGVVVATIIAALELFDQGSTPKQQAIRSQFNDGTPDTIQQVEGSASQDSNAGTGSGGGCDNDPGIRLPKPGEEGVLASLVTIAGRVIGTISRGGTLKRTPNRATRRHPQTQRGDAGKQANKLQSAQTDNGWRLQRLAALNDMAPWASNAEDSPYHKPMVEEQAPTESQQFEEFWRLTHGYPPPGAVPVGAPSSGPSNAPEGVPDVPPDFYPVPMFGATNGHPF